jgi:hypothetical protein
MSASGLAEGRGKDRRSPASFSPASPRPLRKWARSPWSESLRPIAVRSATRQKCHAPSAAPAGLVGVTRHRRQRSPAAGPSCNRVPDRPPSPGGVGDTALDRDRGQRGICAKHGCDSPSSYGGHPRSARALSASYGEWIGLQVHAGTRLAGVARPDFQHQGHRAPAPARLQRVERAGRNRASSVSAFW